MLRNFFYAFMLTFALNAIIEWTPLGRLEWLLLSRLPAEVAIWVSLCLMQIFFWSAFFWLQRRSRRLREKTAREGLVAGRLS